jgi:hypothetical protein
VTPASPSTAALPLSRVTAKAVAGQRFPAKFFWDEEGIGADFEAVEVPGNSQLVHLRIQHVEDDIPWIDADVDRDAVIEALLPPILDFSENFRLAEREWYTPRKLVNEFHQAIMAGIPLRSDIHSPQLVTCSVEGGYDMGYLEGRVFFQLDFEDDLIVSIILFDTNPFWGQLIEFMGDIANGNLPSECKHVRVVKLDMQSIPEIRIETRLVAEPLEVPQNFRLKIFTKNRDEDEFLTLEEVVDRNQFTSGFADSLKDFLETEYRLEPDKEGKTFDLRTLPLTKMDQD